MERCLVPPTSIYKCLFQLDNSKSLHEKMGVSPNVHWKLFVLDTRWILLDVDITWVVPLPWIPVTAVLFPFFGPGIWNKTFICQYLSLKTGMGDNPRSIHIYANDFMTSSRWSPPFKTYLMWVFCVVRGFGRFFQK